MQYAAGVRAAALFAVALVSSTGEAVASCNIIPHQRTIAARLGQPFVLPVDEATPYRGAKGWINRRFIDADAKKTTIEIRRGRSCVPFTGPQPKDVLIALLSKVGPDEARARFVGSAEGCRIVEKARPARDELHSLKLDGCVKSADLTVSDDEVRFSYSPDPSRKPLHAGPTTIVVLALPHDAQATVDVLEKIARERCAHSDLSKTLFCVDEIYRADTVGCSIADRDPGIGHFMTKPPQNVFHQLCTRAQTERCTLGPPAKDLRFAVEDDGDVLIGMDWHDALLPKNRITGKRPRREVSGMSGVADRAGACNFIDIPGDEFLEAQPERAPGDERPLFEVAERDGNALELRGDIDEDNSTLLFRRRKLVYLTCSIDGKTQACEGIEQTCCSECAGECTIPETPAYFACEGGKDPGEPCTRPEHCRPDEAGNKGYCTLSARCQTPARDKACATDCDCTDDPDCERNATSGECGRGLFEFRPATEVVVTRNVAQGECGLCDDDGSLGTKCPSENAPCTSCVSFNAEAGPESDR